MTLSGSISTILIVLIWAFVSIHMCGALPSPVGVLLALKIGRYGADLTFLRPFSCRFSASQVIAMAESMAYAHKAGIDLAVWLPAVASGGAGSFSMTNYAPRIMRRDFEPGFFVDHFIKDMGLALDQCTKMGLSLPG